MREETDGRSKSFLNFPDGFDFDNSGLCCVASMPMSEVRMRQIEEEALIAGHPYPRRPAYLKPVDFPYPVFNIDQMPRSLVEAHLFIPKTADVVKPNSVRIPFVSTLISGFYWCLHRVFRVLEKL